MLDWVPRCHLTAPDCSRSQKILENNLDHSASQTADGIPREPPLRAPGLRAAPPACTGKVGREQPRFPLSLGCEVGTAGRGGGSWDASVFTWVLGKLQIRWAGYVCGLCWVYVASIKRFKNDLATKIHYTCLISDYYYAHGVNLRILTWLKKQDCHRFY